MDPPEPAQGKTIGDVLDAILANPKRWAALLGLLASLCLLTLVVMLVFTRVFGVSTREIKLGGADPHIIFQSIETRTGTEESVVMVTPQGWQKMSIHVRAGERVSFVADGRVCIDVSEVISIADLRHKYEDEVAAAQKLRQNDPTERRVPEDFFTPPQKKSLILHRPWVGPEGFDLARFEPSFRSRRNRYLVPDQNAGSLVAAVREEDSPPTRSDVFVIGRSRADWSAGKSVWLWFTVNDVQYDDPENPDLFYNDNVGVFWVRVVIRR